MESLKKMGENAAAVKYGLQKLPADKKNQAMIAVADAIIADSSLIIQENEKDIAKGVEKGMHPGLIDRLRLTAERIEQMAEGLRKVAALPDPVGEVLETMERPNGLKIKKCRVPMGVIGIIYESRPNVTADAFGDRKSVV